ncbi:snRNA-activating protein of 50kDa MW C terminal-domain-containing protein [Rhodofomes roseus]|uniref:snRNA-activating protein of 50kDa MW C terminal-domain-containing protein n=1 Tax=Rhodofomes roseus TaxID=34475 RepID=A0ABQ8K643_9APHY|nr:snRNA-activating protein of 50kDa MW C terminal-domain-containing protein [Rhodofomes roseus]KAH9832186.1 snRNA-activating protein of 50kDa MW C terminal-domain-containing protein [Rhodofomes roseus]
MSTSLGLGQAHESHFGPTSEYIDIAAFLDATRVLLPNEASRADLSDAQLPQRNNTEKAWKSVPSAQQAAVAAECSLDDLKGSFHDTLTNPRLMAHVWRSHQATVQSIYESAESSNRRKRRKVAVPEPGDEQADVTALRHSMDNSKLKCWPLTSHAASFIRPPKHSDRNTLERAKSFGMGTDSSKVHEALVFVTIYNKLSWGHRQLLRLSQHVLLSSQTLGDLYNVIPCESDYNNQDAGNEPSQGSGEESTPNSADTAREGHSGAVMCIDNTLYGDGRAPEDCAEKVLDLLTTLPSDRKERPDFAKGQPMHETTFASLTPRLHQPYWLLHAGNCEHHFVIEHIRLHHPADPPTTAYPLTTHLTPPLLDLCRACNKVPAVHTILGDMRLGESPFVICDACWTWMGEPTGAGAEDVTVVPLPKYERGWVT